MRDDLYLNATEHEALEPRTREAWGHEPFYCYICWPAEFGRVRHGLVLADFMWGYHTAEDLVEQYRTHPSIIETVTYIDPETDALIRDTITQGAPA